MAASAQSPTIEDIFGEVQSCHAKAVTAFSDAVEQHELGNKAKAVAKYLDALKCSEEGLLHNVHDIQQHDSQWQEVREMQERLISMQGKLKERIYELQASGPVEIGLPPPYSEEDPLKPTIPIPTAPLDSLDDFMAEVLLNLEHGVQIYFVSSDNQVGSPPPSYPTSLQILKLCGSNRGPNDPQAILQVGDKIYPLLKDAMPILKSANGVYMFPNCSENGIQEGSFGVVLSQSTPKADVHNFEVIIQQFSAFHTEDPDEGFVDLTEYVGTTSEADDYVPKNFSDQFSMGISATAQEWVSALRGGTKSITAMIEDGSKNFKSKLHPVKEKVVLSPDFKQSLHFVNKAAKSTVMVKNWLVNWLRQLAVAVSTDLGAFFTSTTDNAPKDVQEDVQGVKKVFRSGLAGFSHIWRELERAGSTIARAVTTETVKNVEFRYGPDAGEAAGLALGAVVSIGETAFTLENIGMKVFADLGTSYLVDESKAGPPMEFEEDHFKDDTTCSRSVEVR